MDILSESSAAFIEKFAALAKRLTRLEVQIYTAELHWGSFGSFTFMVVKGSDAVRFTFDGRESFLTVEASPVKQYCAPNQWSEALTKKFENRSDDPIGFIEEFLATRYTVVG